MSAIEEQVVAIIEDVLNSKLASNEGLLDNGLLDSLKTMNVIQQIEDQHDIEIDPEDFTHENFNSVAGIAAMIEKYDTNS